MKKNVILSACVLAMALSLSACGGGESKTAQPAAETAAADAADTGAADAASGETAKVEGLT